MKLTAPDYYPLFRCIADRCRHTCCAGWEIDVDPETLEKYSRVQGPLASRMKARIQDGHMVLDADERCPFLNKSGLCDIITEMGEGALCQICADHPRYRNFLSGRTEIGVGLACEAAAALILSRQEPMKLITLEDDGSAEALTEDEEYALSARDRMLEIACDRSMPVCGRASAIAEEFDIALPDNSLCEWTDIYLSLERLDENWTERLIAAKAEQPDPVKDETALEQLLACLIFRHILPAAEDGDLEGRIAFVLTSWQFIRDLGGDLTDTARMWSAEIEYSDENIAALTDACFR